MSSEFQSPQQGSHHQVQACQCFARTEEGGEVGVNKTQEIGPTSRGCFEEAQHNRKTQKTHTQNQSQTETLTKTIPSKQLLT